MDEPQVYDVYWCHLVNEPFVMWLRPQEGKRARCEVCEWLATYTDDPADTGHIDNWRSQHSYMGNVNDLSRDRHGRLKSDHSVPSR